MLYRAPRGTSDILPAEQPWWAHVERVAASVCERFGYQRIDTPLFENTGLFLRSVGEATDVAEKETYNFQDRGGDPMTLRPEGTAAVVRAYLEHGMHVLPQPVRLYSVRVPMFRYDRPQAGRYRQFHQTSIEAIGDADATIDAEVIELAWRIFAELGLKDLTLIVNSIGDKVCRPAYLAALKAYYAPHLEELCGDCKRRYDSNVLRLLDCKKASCHPLVENAPKGVDHLCDPCTEHWRQVRAYLDLVGISYTVSHRLVRGLDYYTRTTFEIVPPDEGQQSTLGGGGRYDGLIERLGGKPTPSVGFAFGMERVILNLKRQGATSPPAGNVQAVVAFIGDAAKLRATLLVSELRQAGVTALPAPARSLKAQMRYADSVKAKFTLVLGEDELAQGMVTVKPMTGGAERKVPLAEVAAALR